MYFFIDTAKSKIYNSLAKLVTSLFLSANRFVDTHIVKIRNVGNKKLYIRNNYDKLNNIPSHALLALKAQNTVKNYI